ncbi:hypothetical protein ABPG77_011318 [Micractinium sp. CCAP 211/92]
METRIACRRRPEPGPLTLLYSTPPTPGPPGRLECQERQQQPVGSSASSSTACGSRQEQRQRQRQRLSAASGGGWSSEDEPVDIFARALEEYDSMIEQSKKKLEEGKTSLEVKLGYGCGKLLLSGAAWAPRCCPSACAVLRKMICTPAPAVSCKRTLLCALAPCVLRSWTQRWASCGPAA